MGKLGKEVFRQHVEFECERQLMWHLGAGDPSWLKPLRDPRPRSGERPRPNVAAELGRMYEQHVYRFLRRLPGTSCDLDAQGNVIETPMSADWLTEQGLLLREELPANVEALCLLEHQWETPPGFLARIFDQRDDEPLPVASYRSAMRPDVLLLTRGRAGARELLPGGEVRVVSGRHRLGLRIIDIKHTSEQGVGKRQFAELLFYAHALSHWLQQSGLMNRFYVEVEGHGILPQLDTETLFIQNIDDLNQLKVELIWEEAAHIFEHTCRRIQHMVSQRPLRVEAVPVNIQPACGRCDYLGDCKASLGMGGDAREAEHWDLRLLPYTSRAIAEQLREKGFRTVGDVARGINDLEPSPTPEPLYPEKPLLWLKAEALRTGAPSYPNATGEVQQRHLSMALPQHSNIALTFDVETDPTNDVVFGVAFDLNVSMAPTSPLAPLHDAWWAAWRDALAGSRGIDVAPIQALLDHDALRESELNPSTVERGLKRFATSLQALEREYAEGGEGLTITLPGEAFHGAEVSSALVTHRYGYINMGLEPRQEEMLAKRAVGALYHMLTVSNVLETLLVTQGEGGVIGPSFGGFYWSREQLENIQDMLERHLPYLINAEEVRERFASLVTWLTPSDSGVAHFYQHKKLFNLRTFVETCVGLPHVINYTWHEVASAAFGYHFSELYWPRHFNYMDFATWHTYLQEQDTAKRAAQVQRLLKELLLKVGVLGRLRRGYQRQATTRGLLSSGLKAPVKARAMLRDMPSSRFNPLARFWCLYSKLDGMIGELEAEAARLNYPDWSVGKLSAGRASGVEFHTDDQIRGEVTFALVGLSANMSVREGKTLLLLPESHRDIQPYHLQRWLVTLEELRWDSAQQGYQVRARFDCGDSWHPKDEHPWFELTEEERRGALWFLYPNERDIWSGRLYQNKLHLLSRRNLGASWLGERLAFMWGVGANQVQPPSSAAVTRAELTLYAPTLLPQAPSPVCMPEGIIAPAPDDSQRRAIELALNSPVACIQGPPGTGKSQTIAALIESYLHLHPTGATRILVTAFSYSAMRVVLDKLRGSVNPDKEPSAAARTRMVFARSARREPIRTQPGTPPVDDLIASSRAVELNGNQLTRYRGRRLEDALGERFILFANAHQLYHLGRPDERKPDRLKFWREGFGFDLIIIDEASQVPTDHLLPALGLLYEAPVKLSLPEQLTGERSTRSLRTLEEVSLDEPPPFESLSQLVIVGDHNQLPPVRRVKPPLNLRPFLGSVFDFYAQGHQVPSVQLRTNYRSRPEIVAYTDRINLYEPLIAFRDRNPHPTLPDTTNLNASEWLRAILADDKPVGALIHDQRFETAVSPLEAALTVELVDAFFKQLGVSDPGSEETFWSKHIGIVAPHNAQGRLITRLIFNRLTQGAAPRSHLSAEALMQRLSDTIYSVEKFQGSDRTFIIGSVGISSLDQLQREEEFIYDLNRFNVLTSRARQKMLLICSRNFLEYIPRDRDVMGYAARIRDFAYTFCDESREVATEHNGHLTSVEWRCPG